MDESSFWVGLEFRVCHELSGMRERHFRALWCDGFIPELYLLEDPAPCIKGRAWIGFGGTSRQEQWKFTLFLTCPVGSRTEIEWQTLLPLRERHALAHC